MSFLEPFCFTWGTGGFWTG